MVLLRAEGLTKRFGGMTAVDGFSFHLREGEILGIIGPNGAGKTTVFNLLSGLLVPDAGRVFFEERDITGLRPYQRCRLGFGRTFQIVQPFPQMSVLENVVVSALFGRRGRFGAAEARHRALELCRLVGLEPKADHSPGSLTVAELKRMEVARSLGSEPKVLLLDEPMQGLTVVEAREAVKLVRSIRDLFGVSVLIIEHVMHAVRDLCERVIVMHYGTILAQGLYDEVAADREVVRAYLGEDDDSEVATG